MNIPFHKINYSSKEYQSALNVLKSGWHTMGSVTFDFEKKFLNFINKTSQNKTKYAISVNSCTAALHLSLQAINLSDGDEVIIPSNTFVSTAEVIKYFNAVPVLCDINYGDGNIDVTKIEKLITKKTRAIIPVHYGGLPCDMDEILYLKKKYKLYVIEDAAHCVPSFYKKNQIGSLKSDFTCFSFYTTKTISTIEGGMVLTNHKKFSDIIRRNRLHGISKNAWKRYKDTKYWSYDVLSNGYKYNTNDLCSSLGITQLKKIDRSQQKRFGIAKRYCKGLNKKNIEINTIFSNHKKSSFHLFVIKVKNRNKLLNYLYKLGIQCSVHYKPIHKLKFYKKFNKNILQNSDKFYSRIISLPIYPSLTYKQQRFIIKSINNFFQ